MFALASAVLLLAAGLAAQKTDSAQALLRAATDKAVVDGDLNGAIKQFQTIVEKFKTDRAVVATALIRMAECYQKLGDAESRKIYERVTREFADQTESAALARARLAALQVPAAAHDGPLARLIWAEVDDTEYGPIGVSADGRYVSFTDGSSGDLAVRDLRDGTTRRLTHRGSWAAGFDYAAQSLVSPDGRRVAYGWYHNDPGEFQGSTEIRVLPLSGEPGEPQIVHRSRETSYILPVGWTPDGTSLLVLRRLQDRTGQIAFISIADGSLRVLKSLVRSGQSPRN